MKEGLGDIQMVFATNVPGGGRERKLVFENRHMRPISAYLVNCLAPRDTDIQIAGQTRNYEQWLYEVAYSLGGVRASPLSLAWWSGGGWFGFVGLLLLVRLGLLAGKPRWRSL